MCLLSLLLRDQLRLPALRVAQGGLLQLQLRGWQQRHSPLQLLPLRLSIVQHHLRLLPQQHPLLKVHPLVLPRLLESDGLWTLQLQLRLLRRPNLHRLPGNRLLQLLGLGPEQLHNLRPIHRLLQQHNNLAVQCFMR